ncbi:MAG: 4Fe-4S dicluster domain-containing protein [Planctomycetota bacterium]|jgi:molybdopterin-containing oxidoreductase family iron-sulfur binding subunit
MKKEQKASRKGFPDGRLDEKDRLPVRSDVAGIPVREEVRTPPGQVNRRTVMKLMAASAALSVGGIGCKRKPYRKIVSMAESPEYQHPGTPLFYASTWTEGRIPYGMKVKCVDGRPIKIEGLPGHPLNHGTSSAGMQASILSLYDPDRLRSPREGEASVTWKEADDEIVKALKSAKHAVLMTRSLLGPAERSLIDRFLEACPSARHLVYESVHDGPRRAAWNEIYGRGGVVEPRLSKVKIILSLDSDFLGTDGDVLRNMREFSETRAVADHGEASKLSRLYVAESALTVTGSNADHRIPLKPSSLLALARAIRAALKGDEEPLKKFSAAQGVDLKLLRALASDLKAHQGETVVVAGPHLPMTVHAAVALINAELGAEGRTLAWNPEPAAMPITAYEEIMDALEPGVDALILMGVNPMYDWPGGGFDSWLSKAEFTVGLGAYRNETLARCTFALPGTHNLESWNDASPLPGFHTLCQPMIAPIYDARQEAESLLAWTRVLSPGDQELADCKDWHDYLKAFWQRKILVGHEDSELAWDDALRNGMFGLPRNPPFPKLNKPMAEQLVNFMTRLEPGDLELVILPDHARFDGRFSHNAWLQEFPDPVTKLVWDNGLAMNPVTAQRLGVAEGDLVKVSAGIASVTLPVLVQPGVAHGVVATTLGHGHFEGRFIGTGQGFNAAPLMKASWGAGLVHVGDGAPSGRTGTRWLHSPRLHVFNVTVVPAAGTHKLVRSQQYFDQKDRHIVRHGTRQEYDKHPDFAKHRAHVPELKQLDQEYDYSKNYKWVMAVDLNKCTGCSHCVIACQAENNIPIVGKDECSLGREMHWLRIDQYRGGDDPANPVIYRQPMPCQHCDNAPCESVCPVNATSHSHDGLNEQTYNRCVGTRYCANNCPYKVRRYNFYAYTKDRVKDPVQELHYNPQVTVRMRGVMEKCTFCLQRINEVKFEHKNTKEPIPDGKVMPACAQACPAGAIVFGDINDPESRIAGMKNSSLAYVVLEELNVRPNVHYLARVLNPHPDLAGPGESGGHE